MLSFTTTAPAVASPLAVTKAGISADRPTVVMLGSSRTGLAFHGKRAEQALAAELGRPAVAFNYGVPASGPVTHLVYLDRLLDGGITPDVLVLEVMPTMLTPSTDRAIFPQSFG